MCKIMLCSKNKWGKNLTSASLNTEQMKIGLSFGQDLKQ